MPSYQPGEPVSVSAEQAKSFKARIRISEQYRDLKLKPQVELSLRLWNGEHFVDMKKPRDEHRVVINYVMPTILNKVDSIGFNIPEFVITPKNRASEAKVPVAQAAIAYEWDQCGAQVELRRCLLDKELFGCAFGLVTWEFETTEFRMEDGRLPVEGESVSGEVGIDRKGEPAPVPQADVLRDRLKVVRLDPLNVFVDPESSWRFQEEAQYIGYREQRPLAEVKKDRRLRNTRGLQGTTKNLGSYLPATASVSPVPAGALTNGPDDGDVPAELRRVVLYHLYDKPSRTYVILTDEHDKPLFASKWPFADDKFPIIGLFANPTNDQLYPQSPAVQLQPMQMEINHVRSALHNHIRKLSPRKFVTTKGVLDPQALKQLRSHADGTVVELDANSPEALQVLTNPSVDPALFQSFQAAIQDLNSISAVDQYLTGVIPTKRMTSEEVQAVRNSGGPRVQSDAANFEDFCSAAAQRALALLMQYATKTRELPIYNDDQDQRPATWIDWRADDIKGEYSLSVRVGSTQVQNSAQKTQALAQLITSLIPFAQPQPDGTHMVNMAPLLQDLLRANPDIRDVNKIVPNPAPPGPAAPAAPGAPGPGGPPSAPGGVNPLQALAAQRAGLPAPPPAAPAPALTPAPPTIPVAALPPPIVQAILQAVHAGLVPAPVLQQLQAGQLTPPAVAFLQHLLEQLHQQQTPSPS